MNKRTLLTLTLLLIGAIAFINFNIVSWGTCYNSETNYHCLWVNLDEPARNVFSKLNINEIILPHNNLIQFNTYQY